MKDKTKLVKKQITDKNGKKMNVWVKPHEAPNVKEHKDTTPEKEDGKGKDSKDTPPVSSMHDLEELAKITGDVETFINAAKTTKVSKQVSEAFKVQYGEGVDAVKKFYEKHNTGDDEDNSVDQTKKPDGVQREDDEQDAKDYEKNLQKKRPPEPKPKKESKELTEDNINDINDIFSMVESDDTETAYGNTVITEETVDDIEAVYESLDKVIRKYIKDFNFDDYISTGGGKSTSMNVVNKIKKEGGDLTQFHTDLKTWANKQVKAQAKTKKKEEPKSDNSFDSESYKKWLSEQTDEQMMNHFKHMRGDYVKKKYPNEYKLFHEEWDKRAENNKKQVDDVMSKFRKKKDKK